MTRSDAGALGNKECDHVTTSRGCMVFIADVFGGNIAHWLNFVRQPMDSLWLSIAHVIGEGIFSHL